MSIRLLQIQNNVVTWARNAALSVFTIVPVSLKFGTFKSKHNNGMHLYPMEKTCKPLCLALVAHA